MPLNATTATFALGGHQYVLEDPYLWLSLAAGALCALTTIFQLFGRKSDGVPYKRGLPYIGSWSFFTKRYEFINEGVQQLGSIFAFNILQHKVYAVSGLEARKTFFNNKDLLFREGYMVLFGGNPEVKDISAKREIETQDEMTWFSRRITSILRKDRLAVTLPLMFNDLEMRMDAWGASGVFDPFDDIYNMVFQLTIRAACCREIADDPVAVKKVAKLYWDMERASTPTTVLLPWLPSRARASRRRAIAELFEMLKGIIDDRKTTGRCETDAMQSLIDAGDSVNDIVQFIMSILFAGIINTGIISSWMTLYLQNNPSWKTRATEEIQTFIAKYATNGGSLAQQLAEVPPNVWEEEMPVLEICMRETMRLVLSGSLIRYNAGSDLIFEGVKLPPGTFVTTPIENVHHNPAIYPDPFKWDPSRFERDEDRKEQYAFAGWGLGRHPCLGMRFAKLEVKVILALFLTQFDYELVDASGRQVTEVPPANRNNLYQTPPTKPTYIQYTRKVVT